MKVGDLVRCNKVGVLGIVMQIVDKNPHTGNIDWIYRVLWTEPKQHALEGQKLLSWETLDRFTPFTN